MEPRKNLRAGVSERPPSGHRWVPFETAGSLARIGFDGDPSPTQAHRAIMEHPMGCHRLASGEVSDWKSS